METVIETVQSLAIVILGAVCVVQYIFLSQMMQQIDDLEDRMFRVMSGLEQTDSTTRQSVWRSGIRPAFKA